MKRNPDFAVMAARAWVIAVLLAMLAPQFIRAAETPAPASRAQELKNLKWGMFVCWSFSTFSGKEWTPGVTNIDLFNASGCDPKQWVSTAREAGMGYILFLTKHHDGFCLWDTKTTDRKVTRSPLGRDVLRELRAACDEQGIKLALYFSEGEWLWPNKPDGQRYPSDGGYNPAMKKAQLKELCTEYGPIEYFWMDHAIGDGGLSHEDTVQWVKQFQPGCFVGFNHGPAAGDIRLGELGHPAPLSDVTGAGFNSGFASGYKGYQLAEFTYPILPPHEGGAMWFYSLPKHEALCLPAEKLYRDYLGAVKYGNIFSLDVGPNYEGRLRPVDVQTLRKVGQYIRHEIQLPPAPVSEGKPARASSVWGPGYEPSLAFDGDLNTRWGAAPDSRSGWLEVDLQGAHTITRAILDEGKWDRVREFELQVQRETGWETIAKGAKVGAAKEIRFSPVQGRVFRLVIQQAVEVPTLCEFSLHADASPAAGR